MNALNAIPDSTYYFWTGISKPKSAVGDWQSSLKRLFELGGVPDARAHRFRDTFSVELLLAGVPIERVSILLGHQSVRITEKHYAPWVKGTARAVGSRCESHLAGGETATRGTRRVHGRTSANNSFQIKAKEWWRRGSRKATRY
jgi:hypothetical protein